MVWKTISYCSGISRGQTPTEALKTIFGSEKKLSRHILFCTALREDQTLSIFQPINRCLRQSKLTFLNIPKCCTCKGQNIIAAICKLCLQAHTGVNSTESFAAATYKNFTNDVFGPLLVQDTIAMLLKVKKNVGCRSLSLFKVVSP